MEITYPHYLFSVLGQKFRSFPSLKERFEACSMPLRVRISRFVSAALRSVCCRKPWAVLAPDFSRLRWRLFSLVRLTDRCPCGCWACSALSLKASCCRTFLIISMERFFRDSSILLWVPKDGGRPISVIRTDKLLRKLQLDVIESSPDGFHWLDVTIDVKRSFF